MDSGTITNTLFDSIKIISESVLEGIKFDQTIKCTVTDDSKADQGIYTVSNGTTQFTAYASTRYTKNTQVYVTVPEGDYLNDKVIIGKVVLEQDAPYNYISPFATYADLTGNTIPEANQGPNGLVANGQVREIEISRRQFSPPLIGYNRLGVSANFQAWLFEHECLGGNYGLRIELLHKVNDTASEEANGSKNEGYIKTTMYLNTSDMVGNPYHFESYYRQEKVFDISSLGEIEGISVYFCQDGNFVDRSGSLIASAINNPTDIPNMMDDLDGLLASDIFPNLFVDDVFVSLGLDISYMDKDFVQVRSSSKLTYTPDLGEGETNEKQLEVHWIRKSEGLDQLYKVDHNKLIAGEHEIRWYQHDITAESDGYGGMCWKQINVDETGANNNTLTLTFEPDITRASEQIKAVAVYGNIEYVREDVTEEEFSKNWKKYYAKDNGVYRQCTSEDDYSTVYVQEDSRVITPSSIVTFTNDTEVPSEATLAALNALSIECFDIIGGKEVTSHGNYFLYDDSNSLKVSERDVQRGMKLSFKPDGGTECIDQVSSITWSCPGLNAITSIGSMIVDAKLDDNSAGKKLLYKLNTKLSNDKQVNNTVTCAVTYRGLTYTATKELTFDNAGYLGSTCNLDVDFDDNQSAIVGHNTNTTAISRWLTVHLYDEQGDEVDLEDTKAFTVSTSWAFGGDVNTSARGRHLTYVHSSTSQPNKIKINALSERQMGKIDEGTYKLGAQGAKSSELHWHESVYILKITVTGWKNETSQTSYALTRYVPIPIRYNGDYVSCTGQSEIKYTSDGIPQVTQKEPYSLYVKDPDNPGSIKKATNITWYMLEKTISQGVESGHIYRPGVTTEERDKGIDDSPSDKAVMPIVLDEHDRLVPYPYWDKGKGSDASYYAVMAVDNETDQVVWIQPIATYKSDYFSSTVDNWESGVIDLGENDNTIKSPRLVAGSKNEENKFTGVIIGDWTGQIAANDSIMTKTGLYGFNKGNASFGFNEDGTAFIGESGGARILFNGEDSTIESASFLSGEGGAQIDLNDAKIILRGERDTDEYHYADADETISGRQVLVATINRNNGLLKQTEYDNLKALGIELYTKEKDEYVVATQFDSNTRYYKKQLAQYIALNAKATGSDSPLQIGGKWNPKFKVDWDGTMHATNGEFSGTITGSEICIPDSAFPNFKVDADGSVSIAGNLSIGFALNKKDSEGNDVKVYPFFVDNFGTLSINGGSINIGDFEGVPVFSVNSFGELTMTRGSISLGLEDETSSYNFTVDDYGAVTAKNLTITGGSITLCSSDGTTNFVVTQNGQLTATGADIDGKITADEGTIGGWVLGSNTLSSGGDDPSIVLKADGATSTITIKNDGGLVLSEYGTINIGGLGYISKAISGVDNESTGIGFSHSEKPYRVVCTGANAGIGGDNSWVSCQGSALSASGKDVYITYQTGGTIHLGQSNAGGHTLELSGNKVDLSDADALILPSSCFGVNAPSGTGTTGQVYFKIVKTS